MYSKKHFCNIHIIFAGSLESGNSSILATRRHVSQPVNSVHDVFFKLSMSTAQQTILGEMQGYYFTKIALY